MRRELRTKDETIQQREIDISCLRGQVVALERLLNVHLNDNEASDSDSDTLTNIASLSENEILLEDLDSDNEIPVMQNSKNSKNDHNDVV